MRICSRILHINLNITLLVHMYSLRFVVVVVVGRIFQVLIEEKLKSLNETDIRLLCVVY